MPYCVWKCACATGSRNGANAKRIDRERVKEKRREKREKER